MLIDIVNDLGQKVLMEKVASSEDVKGRLARISNLTIPERDSLTKEAFAWPEEKLFPIHTPEQALVSSAYLSSNPDVPSFVKTACEEACQLWGYDVTIEPFIKEAAAKEVPEDIFLLPIQRKLPVVDRESFIRSKGILEKHASDLSIGDTVLAYRQLTKRASALGETVNEKESILGLYGGIKKDSACEQLRLRSLETGDERYEKIASSIQLNLLTNPTDISNFIFDVSEIDEDNNFVKTASETILDFIDPTIPQEDVFTVGDKCFSLEKVASLQPNDLIEIFSETDLESLYLTGNLDIMSLQKFAEESPSEVQELLGDFIQEKIQ